MNRIGILIVALSTALSLSGLVHGATQEERTLDASAAGTAYDVRTGDTATLNLSWEGPVHVTTSDRGVDRTAFTRGPAVQLNVTLGETRYGLLVSVTGEGVSLVRTGVSADAWRLTAQGTAFVPSTRETVSFRGSLLLLGTDEGYSLSGEGVLTLATPAGPATPYHLTYSGNATFA